MKLKQYIYFIVVIAGILVVTHVSRWLPATSENTDYSKKYYQVCRLAEGCEFDSGNSHILFKVLPASLPALKALQLDVVLEGMRAEQVSVEFVGRDMPMGLVPVVLQKQDYGWLSQHYTGTGSISFCASDRQMVWLARLSITTGEQSLVVDFELQPEKPSAST